MMLSFAAALAALATPTAPLGAGHRLNGGAGRHEAAQPHDWQA